MNEYVYDLLGNFTRAIDSYISQVKELLIHLIWKALDMLLFISRPLYILLFVVGIIGYAFPGSISYRARKIIWGSIILMIFTEFIFPLIRGTFLTPA